MSHDNPVPVPGAIYHGDNFSDATELEGKLEDSFFRFSSLTDFSIFGGNVASVFLSTRFTRLDWYSGIFNGCLFVDCQFEGCTFRGTSFPDCRFVNCVFADCRFVSDNLGGTCVFDDSKWYDCWQSRCEGLPSDVPGEQASGKQGRRSRRWRV